MNLHFIAVGGSVMHQLAIAMKLKGYKITGSDDEIFDPAYSNLLAHQIISDKYLFDEKNIHTQLDAVILGMHAHADNIELKKAIALNLKVYSFPEYIFEQTKDKNRIIIGGSHGKTTTTAMLIHVLNFLNTPIDFLVGGKIAGIEYGVSLKKKTTIFVGEGDEYLASKINPEPKFHFYHPHIAVLTGIAWDHINVFPNYDIYILQFEKFINTIEKKGVLIYNESDNELKKLVEKNQRTDIKKIPYQALLNSIDDQDEQNISIEKLHSKVSFFGQHNFSNASAAWLICKQLGIKTELFLTAMQQFKGVSKRLELISTNENYKVYRDFAHSPSKVLATVGATKKRFQTKKIIAVFELHTYSSLNKDFLKEYNNTMNEADEAVIYFSAHALSIKQLQPLDKDTVRASFNLPRANVFDKKENLYNYLKNLQKIDSVFLLMSSGNFDGLNFNEIF